MSAATKTLLLVVTLGLLGSLAGCANPGSPKPPGLLFDAAHPARTVEHWKIVDDPFAAAATSQPGPPEQATPILEKVLKAGSTSPPEPYSHHGVFLDDRGFFKMPASGKAELRAIIGVVKLKEVMVEIVAAGPDGKMKIRQTVGAANCWQVIVLKLDPAKIKPGSAVRDITFSQMGQDTDSRMYLKSVTLRTE